MKPQEHSQIPRPVGCAFLSRQELSLFRRLIQGRRPLPVYHANGWACHECSFACGDLAAMARHIVHAHRAAPVSPEDLEEDDPASLVGLTKPASCSAPPGTPG